MTKITLFKMFSKFLEQLSDTFAEEIPDTNKKVRRILENKFQKITNVL